MTLHRCPVCDGSAPLFDVVDFNKNCEEARGKFLPLAGRAIYYARCKACDFTFAPEFAQWSAAEFTEKIYNQDYATVDPDYVELRAAMNAELLQSLFGEQKDQIRHLDYGGGNGGLSRLLQSQGWRSSNYDPFPDNDAGLATLSQFNLITAFEVFEHVPDVQRLMKNLCTLMESHCLILFSTLLSDGQIIPNERLTWWYAAPRNGHISLFTASSLKILGDAKRLAFGSFSPGLHCYANQVPDWAAARVKLDR